MDTASLNGLLDQSAAFRGARKWLRDITDLAKTLRSRNAANVDPTIAIRPKRMAAVPSFRARTALSGILTLGQHKTRLLTLAQTDGVPQSLA